MSQVTGGGEELLVSPGMREIWRPFRVGVPLAAICAVWAAIAFARDADDAGAVAVGTALTALGQAAVRTLWWRLRPGRVTVSCDDEGIVVRRGSRVVRRWGWSDDPRQQLYVSPGDRWPEWWRTATFATVEYVTGRWPAPQSVSSPQVLLVRRE